MNSPLNYFVIGHTSDGKLNLIEHNLQNIHHIILLDHVSNIVTTNILKKVKSHFLNKTQIEVICSTRGVEYIDGIIIRQLSLGVVTRNVFNNQLNKANVIKMTIGENGQQTQTSTQNKLNEQQRLLEKEAHSHFNNGFNIHQRLEQIFISEMNFSKADKIKNELEHLLINNVKNKEGESILYQRFFGTNTVDGIINELDSLIATLEKRVFLKGRAGTGKSYLMKQIMDKCQQLDLDIEVYLCSLDPNSIDMIVVRELGFCILDSTSPHEYPNIKSDDILIDMYEMTVTKGTEQKNIALIDQYKAEYKFEMKEGINKLKEIKTLEQEMESKSSEMLTTNEYEYYGDQILLEIEKLTSHKSFD